MSTTTKSTMVTGAPVGVPRVRRRRGVVAGGAMLAALGGLLVAWMITAAGGRTEVLVLAHDVPYGETLTADDFATTAVAVDSLVATVPADDLATVVGKVAASNLVAGALLPPGQVTTDVPPGPGEVLVGLPVPADRLLAGGLHAGDPVLVVDAPSVGADVPATAPHTFEVTVVRVGAADLNGVVMVDVAADEADGPGLAMRAASGRFALVVRDAGAGS